jgi:hypothetical protein
MVEQYNSQLINRKKEIAMEGEVLDTSMAYTKKGEFMTHEKKRATNNYTKSQLTSNSQEIKTHNIPSK